METSAFIPASDANSASFTSTKARSLSSQFRGGALSHINQMSKEDQLKTVSNEFASIFVGMIFKEMGEGFPEDGLGIDTQATKTFREMTYDEYAKLAVDGQSGQGAQGGVGNGRGLGDIIYRGLARTAYKAAPQQ